MCSQVVVNDRAISDGPVLDASIDVSSPQIPACTQHIDMASSLVGARRRAPVSIAAAVYPHGYLRRESARPQPRRGVGRAARSPESGGPRNAPARGPPC